MGQFRGSDTLNAAGADDNAAGSHVSCSLTRLSVSCDVITEKSRGRRLARCIATRVCVKYFRARGLGVMNDRADRIHDQPSSHIPYTS